MTAERNLWCAAVISWLDDYNARYCRAIRKGEDPAPILAEARSYFAGRHGRERLALAGMDISPSQITAAIAMPRKAFKARMLLGPKRHDEREAA